MLNANTARMIDSKQKGQPMREKKNKKEKRWRRPKKRDTELMQEKDICKEAKKEKRETDWTR